MSKASSFSQSYDSSCILIDTILSDLNSEEKKKLTKMAVDYADDGQCMYSALEKLMNCLVITDQRQAGKIIYPLQMLLVLIVLAWLCGCRSALGVANFITRRRGALNLIVPGFKELTKLPSHDTFLTVLSRIVFEELEEFIFQFSKAFLFASQLNKPKEIQLLAADGQCVCGAVENCDNDYQRQYFLTLYNTQSKLSLKQGIVMAKENEIPVLRKMLTDLDLNNCVITLDALHTQIETLKQIRKQNGYSVMQVKENQKTLFQRCKVALAIDSVVAKEYTDIEARGNYVIERKITVVPSNKLILSVGSEAERNKINERIKEWADNSTYIFKIEKTFTVRKTKDAEQLENKVEVSYGITDITMDLVDEDKLAEFLLHARRSHWNIENSLHWSLDTMLNQDRDLKIKCKNLLANAVLLNKLSDNIASFIFNQVTQQPKKVQKTLGIVGKIDVIRNMSNAPDIALEYLLKYAMGSKSM